MLSTNTKKWKRMTYMVCEVSPRMWDSLREEGIKCLQRKTTEETNHYILGKSFYFFLLQAKSKVNHEIDNDLIFLVSCSAHSYC